MVTSGAADVAALGDKLGRLEVGRAADLVVMARQDDDAYESVCASTPADVELVLIGGDVAYGRAEWVTTLAADAADPDLERCGVGPADAARHQLRGHSGRRSRPRACPRSDRR